MINFIEFISEANKPEVDTGAITAKELGKHISDATIKSIVRHPYFQKYVASHDPHATHAYRFIRDKNGFESVYAGNSHVLDTKSGKIRRMVKFDMKHSGRSVTNAHMYHNVDNKRHTTGNVYWEHISSHKPQDL